MRKRCARSIRVRIPLRRHRNRLQNLPPFNPTAFARMRAQPRVKARRRRHSTNQIDRWKPIRRYSASFYQSAPLRVNRRIIAGAQYQLLSRGYFRGRVDGKYGSRTTSAIRAFQSSAGLPPTGRLDIETVKALGSSDADFAYSAPASRGYETWIPVTKFKHGKWKVKWKKSHRPFGGEDADEARQANSEPEPGWNPYNQVLGKSSRIMRAIGTAARAVLSAFPKRRTHLIPLTTADTTAIG